MDKGLISKKELLELTGISYGQLYRWKRKNLIPEEWFIRKSTFTGQETFFPRDKILARIDKVKNMKEDLSLDDLADMLSPSPVDIVLAKEDILARNIISKPTLDFFVQCRGDAQAFTFERILHAYVLEKMLQSGEISLEEGGILLQAMEDNHEKFQTKSCDLIFIRKLGISTCCLVASACEAHFEKSTRVVTRINITKCVQELKLKIS